MPTFQQVINLKMSTKKHLSTYKKVLFPDQNDPY
jgi:hypothetical protein